MRLNNSGGLAARYWQTELPLGSAPLSCDMGAVFSNLYSILNCKAGVAMVDEYYKSILNLVPDLVLLLTRRGKIGQVNEAASKRLGYRDGGLIGRSVGDLIEESWSSLLRKLKRRSGVEEPVRLWEQYFLSSQGMAFPFEVMAGFLDGEGGSRDGGILVMARDTNLIVHDERGLIRGVNEAREQERIRIARDLHDGLGQQLSGVKFLISSMARETEDSAQRRKLDEVGQFLEDMISDVRRVCFNLMPGALDEFGLVRAVQELAERLMRSGILRVVVKVGKGFPWLPKTIQIDLFRVIQEFISNAIRHGQATELEVNLKKRGPGMGLRLRENGRGFEPALVSGSGSGLRNMYLRIRSHGGTFLLNSSPGQGTEVKVGLVINQTA